MMKRAKRWPNKRRTMRDRKARERFGFGFLTPRRSIVIVAARLGYVLFCSDPTNPNDRAYDKRDQITLSQRGIVRIEPR
jgi:hypothetical protein